MARHKRSPALFEVIQARQDDSRPDARPMFRAPRWWPARASATAMATREPAAPREPMTAAVEAAPPPAVEFDPTDVAPPPADPTQPRGHRASAIRFGFDPARQELTLRMRYTAALVTAFSLVMVVALAYVTGRQSATPAPRTTTASTEKIRQGPVHPSVLEVGRNTTSAALAANNTGPRLEAGTGQPSSEQAQPAAARERSAASAIVDDNPQRSIGLNYVIVQSYPDKKSALEAAEFLNARGIPCTAEPGPAGWTNKPGWYSVVGTAGFNRIRSQEFDNYIREIEKAGVLFAGDSKFKRFQPQAYRWRE